MKLRLPLLLSALLLSAATPAQSATYAWTGATDNNIHVLTNWNPALTSWQSTWMGAAATHTILLDNAAATNKSLDCSFNTMRIGGLTVTAAGYSLHSNSSNTRDFEIQGAGGAAEFSIKENFIFGGSTQQWNNINLLSNLNVSVDAGKTFDVYGLFKGEGKTLTVSGGGTMQMLKVTENPLGVGTLNLAEGTTVVVGGSANLFDGTVTQNMTGKGTLELYLADGDSVRRKAILGAGFEGMVVVKTGMFALNEDNGGSIFSTNIGKGTLKMEAGTKLWIRNVAGGTFSNNMIIGAGEVSFRFYGNTNSTIASKMTGSASSIIKLIDGPALISYTGDWSEFGGTYNNDSGRTLFNTGGVISMAGLVNNSNSVRFCSDTLVMGSAGITGGATLFIGTDATGPAATQNLDGKLTLTGTASYSVAMTGGEVHIRTADSELTVRTDKYDTAAKAYTNESIDITITRAISGAGSLVKQGNGRLILNAANTYAGTTTISGGTVDLGTAGTLATSAIAMSGSSTLSGTWASSYTGKLDIGPSNGGRVTWANNLTTSGLTLEDSTSLLSVSGNLTLNGTLSITLDTAQNEMGPMIQLGTSSNRLVKGTDAKISFYTTNAVLEQVGQGVVNVTVINPEALADLSPGDIPVSWANRADEKYTFDTSDFLTSGVVSWTNSKLSMALIDQSEGSDTVTPYAPADKSIYVGAKDVLGGVVFDKDKTYIPVADGAYRLTNGLSNFTFCAPVATSGELKVLGMKGGKGDVILTNNANTQSSTQITDVRLIVDSTGGGGTQLISPGSSRVGILGTGSVNLYGSSTTPAILELRTGGNANQGTGSYLIDNPIVLNENTGITQSGDNSHLLTGTITVNPYGATVISNKSARDLVISADIVSHSTAPLAFNAESGKIVLKGGKSATSSSLVANGASSLEIVDGYTLSTNGIILGDNTELALKNAALNLGADGITSGALFSTSNASIITQGNSKIGTQMEIGAGTTTINVTGWNDVASLSQGIIGTGNLEKIGAGKLVVAAGNDPSTSGTITLKQGTLQLGQYNGVNMADGSPLLTVGYQLGGDLVVESGTLLGAIDANNYNVYMSGSSVFSLGLDMENMSSSISNANNIYVEEGAKVVVDVLDQGWATDTEYFVMSANSGIDGAQFKLELGGEFAFVDVQMVQTAKNLKLILSGKVPDLDLNTQNQNAVFDVVKDMVSEALDGRRGRLNGELLNMMQVVSKMTVDELDFFVKDSAASAASIYSALSGQVANTSRHVQAVRNRITQLDPYLFDQRQVENTRDFWVEGFTNYSDTRANSNAPGYRLDTWGANMGCAFSLDDEWLWGLGFGYMKGKTDVKNGYGDSTTDSYNMDLFARYKKDEFALTAVVSGGFSHVDYKRNVRLKDDMLSANGKANGSQVLGLVEATYDFAMDNDSHHILQPLVNISAGYAKFGGYDETGMGNAGYHVDDQEVTTSTIGAGLRYIYSSQESDSYIPVRGEFRVMVTQDLGDVSYDVKTAYLGSRDQIMSVTGVPLERTAFVIGAAGVLPVGLYTSLFADVTGEFREGQNSVGATIGINMQF